MVWHQVPLHKKRGRSTTFIEMLNFTTKKAGDHEMNPADLMHEFFSYVWDLENCLWLNIMDKLDKLCLLSTKWIHIIELNWKSISWWWAPSQNCKSGTTDIFTGEDSIKMSLKIPLKCQFVLLYRDLLFKNLKNRCFGPNGK